MEFAPNLDIIINETLPALQKVKDSGKAKFIGITGYPLDNFKWVNHLSLFSHSMFSPPSLSQYTYNTYFTAINKDFCHSLQVCNATHSDCTFRNFKDIVCLRAIVKIDLNVK